MLPDPKKMIVKRIINELEEKDRHKLFVGGLF
jgi:predicted nucleic acid-binding OB-fold protein